MTFPQATVLPEAHAIAALREIAKLHGHCWGRRDEWNAAHPDAPMYAHHIPEWNAAHPQTPMVTLTLHALARAPQTISRGASLHTEPSHRAFTPSLHTEPSHLLAR